MTLLTLILLFAGVVLPATAVRWSRRLPEWTVEAFGGTPTRARPVLHLLMPVYQGIGRKINMMEQVG